MAKIAVVGATGRMGRTICDFIINQNNQKKQPYQLSFVSSIERAGQNLGSLLGIENLNLMIEEKIEDSIIDGEANFDVLIDFTSPVATLEHLKFCKKYQKAIVIGTTGFSEDEIDTIKETAHSIPIVFSPNMSIGVNLVFKTIEFLATALDESFDAEIIEAHHKHKVDSPSGTALKMGQIIAKARGVDFDEHKKSRAFGVIGERKQGEIGFSAIRGGDIVGDHSVLFATEGEVIELSHRSSSRFNYAKGALLAAIFCSQQNQKSQVGMFDMFDVLNLKQLKS